MTNTELIATIRNEIEQLENYYTSVERHVEALISILDALESEKQKEVKPCHRTRKRLAEWSKTPEGRKSYEKVAEEMRKQIVPNDLEEAARKSAIAPFNLDIGEEHLDEYPYLPIAEQKFIEGAKWQKEQDEKEQADLFTIVALDAAQRATEQMMREAVEGEITKDNRGNNVVCAGVLNKNFEYGDKVRVIVCKNED